MERLIVNYFFGGGKKRKKKTTNISREERGDQYRFTAR